MHNAKDYHRSFQGYCLEVVCAISHPNSLTVQNLMLRSSNLSLAWKWQKEWQAQEAELLQNLPFFSHIFPLRQSSDHPVPMWTSAGLGLHLRYLVQPKRHDPLYPNLSHLNLCLVGWINLYKDSTGKFRPHIYKMIPQRSVPVSLGDGYCQRLTKNLGLTLAQ